LFATSIAAFSASGADYTGISRFLGHVGPQRVQFRADAVGPRPVTICGACLTELAILTSWSAIYNNPILKPQAAQVVKEKGEISIAGKNYPDPFQPVLGLCATLHLCMQLGLQILQQKDRITMIYNQDDQVRYVRLNAKHPANVTPSQWAIQSAITKATRW